MRWFWVTRLSVCFSCFCICGCGFSVSNVPTGKRLGASLVEVLCEQCGVRTTASRDESVLMSTTKLDDSAVVLVSHQAHQRYDGNNAGVAEPGYELVPGRIGFSRRQPLEDVSRKMRLELAERMAANIAADNQDEGLSLHGFLWAAVRPPKKIRGLGLWVRRQRTLRSVQIPQQYEECD